MRLTFASYNIHKGIGTDRRRDPDRILTVLREIDADIVALQEADLRFGSRAGVLPLAAIDEHTPYRLVALPTRPESLGWHGNALLVRRGFAVQQVGTIALPTLEPRGAVRADVIVRGRCVRVVGMHLDLSGLRRRQQVRSVLAHVEGCAGDAPAVLMGDTNEWSLRSGCLREFDDSWRVLAPGRSFPSRRPLAQLDRIIVSRHWQVRGTSVHHSALAAKGSDHLPVCATLYLPE